jgi:cytoskeletal protein CcmA (bactofilin family)
MGFFKRTEDNGNQVLGTVSISRSGSRSRPRSRSKSRKKESQDLQGASRTGLVSGVLSDPGSEAAETPHSDIVERRFGPGMETAQTVRPDPAPIEPKESPVVLEMQELETPDLEIDSMAHIGRSTTINGDIVAEEDLEIEGTVEGTVTLAENRVTIGAEGIVKARVQAASVVVVGRIEGDVSSPGLIEVKAGGYIGGNVKSPRVILHDGAIVIGGLDMSAALSTESLPGTGTSQKEASRTASNSQEPKLESPLLIRVDPESGEASAEQDRP